MKSRELEYLISENFESGNLSDEDLVNIINLCGAYLNLISPSDLAKRDGISSVSANKETKYRKFVNIFGVRFISEEF